MLTAAFWTLGFTVAAGIGLACFYLMERPIRGRLRLGSFAHGAAGTVGAVLALAAVWRAPSDDGGFGRLSAGFLAATLIGGLLVLLAQLRHRKPAGMLVAIHASLGVAGYVILAAYFSLPH